MSTSRPGDGVAAGSFVQCKNCKKTLFAAELEGNLMVCPSCDHHHRLDWKQRVSWTFDPDTFVQSDTGLQSQDPLNFPEYAEKHASSVKKTGMDDSAIGGMAQLGGRPVSLAVADFNFMGGSMGSVNGEIVTRALERGVKESCPVIVFCASGGARMQEGLLSLMQMAKTTAAVEQCRAHGVPFISVFTDPTMAGVLASYASIADVIIAEPKALIGFAGARVSAQAGVSKPPADFQSAEFVLRSGMLDRIVHRRDMRATLTLLTGMFGAHLEAARG